MNKHFRGRVGLTVVAVVAALAANVSAEGMFESKKLGDDMDGWRFESVGRSVELPGAKTADDRFAQWGYLGGDNSDGANGTTCRQTSPTKAQRYADVACGKLRLHYAIQRPRARGSLKQVALRTIRKHSPKARITWSRVRKGILAQAFVGRQLTVWSFVNHRVGLLSCRARSLAGTRHRKRLRWLCERFVALNLP